MLWVKPGRYDEHAGRLSSAIKEAFKDSASETRDTLTGMINEEIRRFPNNWFVRRFDCPGGIRRIDCRYY